MRRMRQRSTLQNYVWWIVVSSQLFLLSFLAQTSREVVTVISSDRLSKYLIRFMIYISGYLSAMSHTLLSLHNRFLL